VGPPAAAGPQAPTEKLQAPFWEFSLEIVAQVARRALAGAGVNRRRRSRGVRVVCFSARLSSPWGNRGPLRSVSVLCRPNRRAGATRLAAFPAQVGH